jgi:hypothetical protein
MDTARADIISELERCELDGSREQEDKALELVRRLQVFLTFKREMLMPLAVQRVVEQRERVRRSREND